MDIPTPEPEAGEALIRVTAAGVNPLDNMIVRGEVKLIVPYRTPLVMGNELVGTVEELGLATKGFKVGDRVYCRMPLSRIGAFAEYAAVDCGALDNENVMLGRIVVLPEYRGQGIGTLVVKEAEKWAKELGFKTSVVESRDNKIHFYETMDYVADLSQEIVGETFTCYRMEKKI